MLAARGIDIADFLPLDELKEKYASSVRRYGESGDAAALGEVEKWDAALNAHPDMRAEQETALRAWRTAERGAGLAALRTMRSIVPLNCRGASAAAIASQGLPLAVARRIAFNPGVPMASHFPQVPYIKYIS